MDFNSKTKRIVILVFTIFFMMNSFTLYAEPQSTPNLNQILGDCNNDGKVTIDDLVIIALHFSAQRGDVRYNYEADVNHDGVINAADVVMMKQNYGELNPSTVPIIAFAGQDFVTYKDFNVVLDSSKSYIAEGITASYSWSIIEKPEGSNSDLDDGTLTNPSFAPDMPGTYKISLNMNDGQYYSRESIVNVTVKEIGDTTDTMDISSIDTGKSITTSYDYTDMIPLTDGWVITKDKVNKEVVFYNVLLGMNGKEYSTSLGVPNRMEIDYERNQLYVSMEDMNKIAKIDLKTGTMSYLNVNYPITEFTIGELGIIFVLSNDGSYTYLEMLDTETQAVLSSIKQADSYELMVYDKFANNLILGEVGSSASALKSYAFNSEEFFLKEANQVWDAGINAHDLSISNDGAHVAFPGGGGNGSGYTIFDITSSDITQHSGVWDTGSYPTSATFSLDDRYFIASNGSDIKIFNRATYELINTIDRRNTDSYDKVNISRGGRIIFDTVGQKLDVFQSGIEQLNVAPPVVSSKPIAIVGRDKITYQGFNVQLNGSRSRIVDEGKIAIGSNLTYTWTIESNPADSLVTLTNPSSSQPSFIPDVIGDYTISLVVNNGLQDSDKKFVNVKVKDISSTTDDITLEMVNSLPGNIASGFANVKPVALTDGWMIAADGSSIKIVNVLSGDVPKQYPLAGTPTSIDFDFEQKRIFSTLAGNNKIAVIDTVSGNVSYINTTTAYTGIEYGEDNVAFAVSSGGVGVIDLTSGTNPQHLSESIYNANLIEYDKTNNNLILAEKGMSPSTLFRFSYNAETKQLTKQQEISYGGNGLDLAMSNDGTRVVFSCGGGNGSVNGFVYTLFDISSSDISSNNGIWNLGAYPTSAVFSSNDQYLIASDGTNLKLLDVATHNIIKNIGSVNEAGNYDMVFISRGDKLIYDLSGGIVKFMFNN